MLEGVTVAKTMTVKMIPTEPRMADLPSGLDPNNQDDRIIGSVLEIQSARPSTVVVLVTDDTNLQNKAEMAFLPWAEPPELATKTMASLFWIFCQTHRKGIVKHYVATWLLSFVLGRFTMAKKTTTHEPQPPVVVAIFEDLIRRLESDSSIDATVVRRLRDVLLRDQDVSADALKAALFTEEPLP